MTNIKLSTDAIKNIGQIAATTDHYGVDRKLAIIVNSDLAYGLARMYKVYRRFSGRTRKELHVFKDAHEAFEWVKTDP